MDSPGDQVRARLSRLSERLLESVKRMRRLEEEKRRAEISTPRFHALAEEIEAEGRKVFLLADAEEAVGDQTRRRGDSIEEFDRTRSR